MAKGDRHRPRPCECGCGATTRGGRFLPGHNARLEAGRPAIPPPLENGNMLGLKHGAYCSRLVLPEADALASEVMERVPHLEQFPFAVRDWAVAQTRAWRLAAYLERNGEMDRKGRMRPEVEALRRWLSRAETARSRIGLDPVSFAALRLDVAESARIAARLAEQDLEEGRRLREARREQLESEAVQGP